MRIDANDPRWTAYVLGELADERERAEIEAALSESAEARALLDDIRGTAQLLAAELRAEPAVVLAEAQRQRIEARADHGWGWFAFRYRWAIACAAPVALAAVVMLAVHPFTQPESNPAKTSSRQSPATGMRPDQIGGAALAPQTQAAASLSSPAAEKLFAHQNPRSPLVFPAGELKPGMLAQLQSPAAQGKGLSSMTGILVDQSGAVIPGGTVQVKDEATGDVYKAVSGQNGVFLFPSLKPGEHTLTASMPNFRQTVLKGLVLTSGVPQDVRVTLAIGGTTETVVVQAGAEAMQTTAASISSAVPTTIHQLPLQARASTVLALSPGIATGAGAGRGGAVVIDGVELRQRLDSIQEATVQTMFPGRFNTEAYEHIKDNEFQDVAQRPLSTFSIDVDTASYANLRRFLNNGQLPPKDSVRVEELINYFSYDYLPPNNGKPFAAHFEITEAPWNPEHRLLRIGIKGRELRGSRPPCNLVFLLDVSGSMADANKLPLVKESMRLLLDQLTEDDHVAIVVYATEARVFLPSTRCDQKTIIRAAIDSLSAGGTTNGAGGIQLAYDIAQQNFLRKGVNRVILATDGDFNVGITNRGDLTRLIAEKCKNGIYLSALGFGMGNLKDSTLELLADKGDGNYAYIDTFNEARKVLAEELNGALVTIAKDVKIQVEFNPAEVSSYRLIGYENRLLRKEDFNNDAKDAGEIGAGHAVTVFYELVPAGRSAGSGKVDPLKYQRPALSDTPAARSGELLTLKIRHKEPDQQESTLSEYVVRDTGTPFGTASRDFKFAAAVAAFGMWLRDSPYKGRVTMEDIQQWARQGQGSDPYGYRQELLELLRRAESLRRK